MFIAAAFVVDNKRQVYMSIDPLMLNFFWIMIVEFFEINSLHLYWHRSHYRKRKITFISAFTIQIVHMSWTYMYIYIRWCLCLWLCSSSSITKRNICKIRICQINAIFSYYFLSEKDMKITFLFPSFCTMLLFDIIIWINHKKFLFRCSILPIATRLSLHSYSYIKFSFIPRRINAGRREIK